MMKLYINGREAVLKEGTSFKLVRENPYFSSSEGDYTFEVVLPIAGCPQNRILFGPIDRLEISHTGFIDRTYPMRLLCPPLDLNGLARITSCDKEEVKVQLMAGRTGLRNASNQTVNRLPLGSAWDSFPEFSDGHDSWLPGRSSDEMVKIFHYLPKDINLDLQAKVDVLQMAHGTQDHTDSVCFPILAKQDNLTANPWPMGLADRTTFRMQVYCPSPEQGTKYPEYTVLAPQPYLLDIAKRVIRALGYTVGDWSQYNNNPLAWGIFIANCRGTLRRAETLPEWSIEEWLHELQNFFGCVFVVHGDKQVDMVPRKLFYMQGMVEAISNVVDDWQIDTDRDSENKGSSAGNVDYDWPDISPMLRLPDEVWEHAERLELPSMADIRKKVDLMSEEEKSVSRYLFQASDTKRLYALLYRTDTQNYILYEIGQFEPLWRNRNKRNADTTLRIVPAQFAPSSGLWGDSSKEAPSKYNPETVATCVPILQADDTTLTNRVVYSVNEAVNPIDPAAEKYTDQAKQILEVAYNGGSTFVHTAHGGDYPLPMAQPYVIDDITGLPVIPPTIRIQQGSLPEPDGPFSLCRSADNTITGNVAEFMSGEATIDTRTVYIFSFVDHSSLDPTKPYLIRGRRYACQKLEVTIDSTGVQPLKRGYFFEIN